MNWTRANQVLQTGANVGILLGLILVGVQISETNRIASGQFVSEDLSLTMTSYDLVIGEGLAEALSSAATTPTEITEKDLIIIDAALSREWYRKMRDRDISRLGLRAAFLGVSVNEWVFQWLGNEITLRWWAVNQDGLLGAYPELRDAINERLSSLSEAHIYSHASWIKQVQTGKDLPIPVSDFFN